MLILGIETSCDETGAAVLSFDSAQDHGKNGRIHILSNVVASSALLQAKYGGIIPEQAAREQIKSIIPVIEEALTKAFPHNPSPITHTPAIDAIAVTYGPGLIGSLLVGVETAKTLALIWNKPLIPVNHLIGHFYANWITNEWTMDNGQWTIANKEFSIVNSQLLIPSFPCLGLLVSGGHTDLVLFTDHGKYKYLGGTRDDAAGECFDKCARLLGLPYPGGPEISKLAKKGGAFRFNLPRPMIDSDDFDFSFSGLKTAVANLLRSGAKSPDRDELASLAASIEQAIVDVLVAKTIKAAQVYKVNQIMIAGGVAANQKLVSELKKHCQLSIVNCQLFIPPPYLCTDNAAMIAAAAFFSPRFAPASTRVTGEAGQKPIKDLLKLQADPNLSLS